MKFDNMRQIDILGAMAQEIIDRKEREKKQTFRDKHLWKFELFGGLFFVAIMTVMMFLETQQSIRRQKDYQEIFNQQNAKWETISEKEGILGKKHKVLAEKATIEKCVKNNNKPICKYIEYLKTQ